MRIRSLAEVCLVSMLASCGSSSSDASPVDGGVDSTSSDSGVTSDSSNEASSDASDASDGPSTMYPAFKPPRPKLGGGTTVIASPVFAPVFFPADSEQSTIDGSITSYLGSKEWSALSEYGIGAGTKSDAITLTEAAPTTATDDDIQAWLKTKLDGTHAEFGAVDATTLASKIFLLFYPASTTITYGSSTSCAGFGTYHSGLTLPSSAVVQYVVVPRCPPAPTATSVTYMLSSAPGDPSDGLGKVTGYSSFDVKTFPGNVAAGTEIGTACEFLAAVTPSDLSFAVARTWSNAASLAYHDPCVPTPDSGPYFTSVPIPADMLTFSGTKVKGVSLASGSATIEVQLLSDGPTSGDWSVKAFAPFVATTAFTFAFDKSTGNNGDVLHLTITGTALASPTVVAVTSTLGTRKTIEYFAIGK